MVCICAGVPFLFLVFAEFFGNPSLRVPFFRVFIPTRSNDGMVIPEFAVEVEVEVEI